MLIIYQLFRHAELLGKAERQITHITTVTGLDLSFCKIREDCVVA